ncbi:hypothetical protein [Paenarthrobacter nitroguajacolicus]|uniref:hypothetical protein n=1 Tax=Paenarthrobacter nitroguajacolicus TaxID=211146 RepID=UPI00248BB238|nr:hypothetical protein [Paenarthrobacter nitroguajacolicus]MDI2033740.1 hypothetical protein [Paenarthrobacter nitroguajacolicus]
MSTSPPSRDHELAELQSQAARLLLERGAAELPQRPWLHETQPPTAMDLIQHALWRSRSQQGDQTPDASDLSAALALVPAARGEMDAVETALLFLARAEGLTWPQIAQSLGLRSAQAAQQRLDRLSDRPRTAAGNGQ